MSKKNIKPFGGAWSDAKLIALSAYLEAYTHALKNKPFKLAYIDAFAGAGLRDVKEAQEGWFNDEFIEEDKQYRHGSPLIALSNKPKFQTLIFIEKDAVSLNKLQEQIETLPEAKERDIHFLQGDANTQLQALMKRNWSGRRAVAFLDPFALEVNWDTIEHIAKTEAVDMWLLFPAMAVNRMLPKSGKIPPQWTERLNRLFGTNDWQEIFYTKDQPDLFGDEQISKTPKVFELLSEYVTQRLKSVFAGTHKSPLILRNSSGAPLFLLCFASGNPRGAPIATRIAQHIINSTLNG
ncbi:MAG: three-Cys-motif partner protein TcmP [Opitutaceae bacterium]